MPRIIYLLTDLHLCGSVDAIISVAACYTCYHNIKLAYYHYSIDLLCLFCIELDAKQYSLDKMFVFKNRHQRFNM